MTTKHSCLEQVKRGDTKHRDEIQKKRYVGMTLRSTAKMPTKF